MAYKPILWKATAFEQLMEHLEGAKIGKAGDYMLGHNCKILVFEDNEKAEKFKLILESIYENA